MSHCSPVTHCAAERAAEPTEWTTELPTVNIAELTTESPTGTGATEPTDQTNKMPGEEVERIIRGFALYGGTEFDFAGSESYQNQALRWMKVNTQKSHSISRIKQRYTLACLYKATYAVRTKWTDFAFGVDVPILPWVNNRGWLSLENECNWFGVECAEQKDGENSVVAIKLANNILTGKFPSEIALLSQTMKTLDIYNNFVYNVGDDELSWLGDLVELEFLYYGSCSFEYPGIPPFISKLTKLIEFDCSYVMHSGPLKEETFAPLTNLEYLYIGGNSFNSSIPSSIGTLPNLLYLYSEYSDIIGTLDFMNTMPKIYVLQVDQNRGISGTINSEIGTLSTLEYFSATNAASPGQFRLRLAC
jgi:hypothetical protein